MTRLGEGDRCPLCGATAGVAQGDDGYTCLLCGAPRVLVDGIVQRRGSEKPLLERAKALKFRRAVFGIIAALALLFGILSLTVSSLAALFLAAVGVHGLPLWLFAILPFGASLASWLVVRNSSRAIHAVMNDAEVAVAKELIESGAVSDPGVLGRLMHLPSGRTDELFGLAEVERLLDPSEGLPPQKLRVEAQDVQSADPELETRADSRNRAR